MKKRKTDRGIFLGLILLSTLCFGGELRTWTLKNGSSVEAECLIVMGGKATFKLPSGKIVKVPMDRLNAADRRYIELENPPKFKVEFVRDRNQKIFDLMSGQFDYTLRPPEYRCYYGVKIKQRDTYAYKYKLQMEFFAIGQERAGSQLILLDHQKTEPFTLTRNNDWFYKFLSKREVVLQNYLYGDGPNNGHQKRGRKYYGYLILVRDIRGKIIMHETSHKWLYEHLETLNERSVGNYMDKTCTRTFPTRPYNKRLGKE